MDFQLQEIQELEKQIQLLREKLSYLEKEIILANDPEQKFSLRHRIIELEADLQKKLKKRQHLFDFHTPEGKSVLQSKVAELKIDVPLGNLHLVNCNRKSEVNQFWETFDTILDAYFHYYFISACSTQMPPSFSERMIYELIIEELDENDQAILCDRNEQNNRIKIHPLPIGRNLKKSQQQFRKFFANFFEFEPHISFEDFLQTGIPRMEYAYVALVFEVYQNDWKPFYTEYFNWIIDCFRHKHEDVPTFLFFFVTYVDGLHHGVHQREQEEIINSFNLMSETYAMAAHFTAMPPVPVSDLKNWLMKLGNRNPAQLDELINTLAKGLKGKDLKQYEEQQKLNMDDVERLQELVVQKVNRTY